jgi:hypothetical protein
MVNKRNSEKLGGVRPSQRQRVSAIASLQCRQELTKKNYRKEEDLSNWLETCIRIMHECTSWSTKRRINNAEM